MRRLGDLPVRSRLLGALALPLIVAIAFVSTAGQDVDLAITSWGGQITEPNLHGQRDVSTRHDLDARDRPGTPAGQFAAGRAASARASAASARLPSDQAEAADAVGVDLQRLLLLGVLAAALVGPGLAWLLAWCLTHPVARLARPSPAIADGSLTLRLTLAHGDEFDRTARPFDRTPDRPEQSSRPRQPIRPSAAEGIVGLDLSGRVTFANPAAARLIGRPVEDLLGQPLCTLVHPRAQHAASRCPLHPDPGPSAASVTSFEDRFWQPDGTSVPVECVRSTIVSADQAAHGGSVLTLRDLSERQEATVEAARSEAERAAQHFGDLVHGLGVVVWEREPQHCQFTFVSRGAQDMLGYPAERWLEPNFWSRLLHPDDRQWALQMCQAAARDGQPRDYEYRALAAGGEVLWVREILHVVPGPTGQTQTQLLRGVLTNVTERKRLLEFEQLAHAQAESERQRAQFLSEASAALSSSLDYEATLRSVARLAVPFVADWCAVDVVDEDGRVRRVAAAHVDPSREVLVWRVQQRAPDPAWDRVGLGRILRTGRPELIVEVPGDLLEAAARDAASLELIRTLAPRSYIGVPLVARGRTLGAIFLVTAESGRRYGPDDLALAEEVGRRASQAVDHARLYAQVQQAVRVRDEFLAATSHELRTPLAHVKGFVSTLRQADVQWDEATRQDFLGEIEREADRLARLIGNLLDISRIESGGLDPSDRAPTRPRDLVAGGLQRVRGLLGQHPVTVEVPDDLPLVNVDSTQLEGVMANLVENATKYTPPGTPLRLIGRRGGDDAAVVELRVEDAGPGIPPEDLERIFDTFVRGAAVRASRVPGSGLGLAICRGLVRANGGRIWATNRPQGGAVFILHLPVAV